MEIRHTGSIAHDGKKDDTDKFFGNCAAIRETVNRVNKEFCCHSDNLYLGVSR